MSDIVSELENNLKDQPDHCLRPHQRISLEEEAVQLKGTLSLPDSITGAGKPHARERYSKVVKMLAEQAPRAIDSPLKKDEVDKQHKQVLNEVILPAMLSRAEMRRNPAGAVGEFMRRENSPYVQRGIRAWKRARFALEPQTQDDDHALIEKYRPEVPHGTPFAQSTWLADSQVPGVFAMTPQAKENWPLPAPTNTAIEQVRQAEVAKDIAEVEVDNGENGRKGIPVVSTAQRDALAAGRVKLAAKRAAAKANLEAIPGVEDGRS